MATEKKEPVKQPQGFKPIADFKPKFVSVGPISSQTEKIFVFLDKAENKHYGVAHRYDRDFDSGTVQRKKDDVVFIDHENNIIDDVTHFIP